MLMSVVHSAGCQDERLDVGTERGRGDVRGPERHWDVGGDDILVSACRCCSCFLLLENVVLVYHPSPTSCRVACYIHIHRTNKIALYNNISHTYIHTCYILFLASPRVCRVYNAFAGDVEK